MIIPNKRPLNKKNVVDGYKYLSDLEDYVYGSKRKHNPTHVDFSQVSEPILLPSAIRSWCSVFIPFRSYSYRDKKYSKVKLSLRKYKITINGKYKWGLKHSMNINTATEAKQLYKLLITYFPEVLID